MTTLMESAAPVTHSGGSYAVLAVILAVMVIVALGRLLRHMGSMVTGLIGSAGALVTLLVTLFGAGVLLVAVIITAAIVG